MFTKVFVQLNLFLEKKKIRKFLADRNFFVGSGSGKKKIRIRNTDLKNIFVSHRSKTRLPPYVLVVYMLEHVGCMNLDVYSKKPEKRNTYSCYGGGGGRGYKKS